MSSASPLKFFPAVLRVLGLSSSERQKVESDVVGLVVVKAIDKLTEGWSEEEQRKLTQEIESKAMTNQGHHDPVILKHLSERFGHEAFMQSVQTAAGELMPQYIQAVLQVATDDQKAKIKQVVSAGE